MSDDDYWSRGMPSSSESEHTCRRCGKSGEGIFGNKCGGCDGTGTVTPSYPSSSEERKCSWGPESDNT